MVCHRRKNKAQTILEYATVIACAVAALLTMQVYIKRAYQWKLKENADSFGPQYAPRRTTGDSLTTYNSDSITQSLPLNEQDVGYDANGNGVIDDDITLTRTVSGYGIWNDANSDGIIQPEEITNGTRTTRSGNETVGIIKADEGLFDE